MTDSPLSSKSSELAYLREMFGHELANDAGQLLVRRRTFLNPDLVIATSNEVADAEDRSQQLAKLQMLRQQFWQLDESQLMGQLQQLSQVPHAEIVVESRRLLAVAQTRPLLAQLPGDPFVDTRFARILVGILLAPASEASRLRARDFSWMRPELNPHYQKAAQQMKLGASMIQQRYPAIFALEDAWLMEILEYNPVTETNDNASDSVFVLIFLVMFVAAIAGVIAIIRGLFQ